MTTNRFYILCTALAITLGTQAQQQPVSGEQYRYADETQLWRLTGNAAGLSLDVNGPDTAAVNRGVAYFQMNHRGGDLHRVQEGGQQNTLEFFTERYQKIGKYLYGYGSFHFNMGRTKQRAWSDVLRTYNSNPYISGSSVFGSYDQQNITLDASLSTIRLGHFTYGANLFYQVGDLSRLRDPRSRINLAEYRLTPSVTYTFGDANTTAGRHTAGLSLHYDRRKEKLPSLSTVQTDPTLMYYVMTGLENADGAIGYYNGYMREYVNHEFGGELSYQYRDACVQSLTTLSLAHGTEYVYGTNKYEPGRYYTYSYGLSSRNRLHSGRLLHTADLSLNYEEGYADEYRQERTQTTDATTGITSVRWNTTMRYNKRYQLKKFDLDVHYRLSFTNEQKTTGYVGAEYVLQNVRNRRLLRTSQLHYASSEATAEGGWLIGRHLWAEARAGYHFATKADLQLANVETTYAQAVLLPDMTILDADYFRGRLQLTYQTPLTIKGYTSNWFASAYADHLKASHGLHRTTLGVSIGLYY